jgi:hypothetical protein
VPAETCVVHFLPKGSVMKAIAVLLAIGGWLALSSPGYAESQEQGACRGDVQKFCKDVRPGGGAIARCLKRHEPELSGACRERMAQGRQRAEEFADACKADAEKLCKQVQPGSGRLLRCLASRRDQLSPACGQKIAEAEKRHPCMADIERLCGGVQPGEGRIDQCLRQHQGELGGACKTAMGKKHKGAKD